MDSLSEALHSVRMTGAIFFDAICTAPWGFAVPAMERAAPLLSPGTERLIGYHLVAEGKAFVRLEGAAEPRKISPMSEPAQNAKNSH